ncbi:MAG: Maf family nucleotide pyrophosphatase [Pseudomonadota bacterium]|nr:Maf family nucleotide pyrophosphatase [Pseudomonadota bacterium]
MTATLPDGRRLILASTSAFRRELLVRLQLPFDTAAPAVDETPRPGEAAIALVTRLAEAKARAVAGQAAGALVIGSDQVAVLDGKIIGKPGGHPQAVAQLTRAAGRTVVFHTGLCLVDSESGRAQRDAVAFRVVFRALTAQAIDNYLRRERPYQCAGSFKSEGLGIALFERLEGDDPTALIGLPLIRLVRMLEAEGVAVL